MAGGRRHKIDERDGKQIDKEQREHHPQPDRGYCAQRDALEALRLKEARAGERDHDRIIARKKNVDPDDLKDRESESRQD